MEKKAYLDDPEGFEKLIEADDVSGRKRYEINDEQTEIFHKVIEEL